MVHSPQCSTWGSVSGPCLQESNEAAAASVYSSSSAGGDGDGGGGGSNLQSGTSTTHYALALNSDADQASDCAQAASFVPCRHLVCSLLLVHSCNVADIKMW